MEPFRAFAERLAEASGPLILEAHRGAPRAEPKDDGSPVTAVDRAVEDRLRAMIAEAWPEHGIVGEERPDTAAESEFVWVLDPIDGTLPFLAGLPVFGTLIALVRQGTPVLGVVDLPATRERWVGVAGRPTLHNGRPVRTRTCASLAEALAASSNPDFFPVADRPALDAVRAAARWTVYGGSCLSYARLASGRIDLGIDVALDIVDYLALVPVIEGAGGVITDWRGEALTLDSGDRILAAGDARVHAEALGMVAG